MGESVSAFIALGSNMGDRLASLRGAVCLLGNCNGIDVNHENDVAGLFETKPVGGPAGQADYLNSAMRVRTTLEPKELMEALLAIERNLGQTRREPWESRIIDLDLLLYGQLVCNTPLLKLPHPRMHERRFVLEPLAEIAADVVHPTIGRTIGQMAADLRGSDQVVTKIMGPQWFAFTD